MSVAKPSKPRSTIRTAFLIILGFSLLFMVLGWAASGDIRVGVIGFVLVFTLLPIGLALLYIPIPLHEFGHWYGARKYGFQVLSVEFGPIKWSCITRRWSERTATEQRIHEGFVRVFSARFDDIESRYKSFVWCGPLASFASGAAFLAMWVILRSLFPHLWFLSIPLLILWTTSFCIFAASMYPWVTKGGQPSDGAQLFRVKQYAPSLQHSLAIGAVNFYYESGVSIKQIPAEFFEVLNTPSSGSATEVWGLYVSSLRDEELKDYEAAADRREQALLLAKQLNPCQPKIEANIRLNLADILAWKLGKLARAEELVGTVDESAIDEPLRPGWLHCRAAIALAKGDLSSADSLANEARKEVAAHYEKLGQDPPSNVMEDYDELLNDIQEAASSNLTPE